MSCLMRFPVISYHPRSSIYSQCWEGEIIIDGRRASLFPHGQTAIIEALDEDALLTAELT